MWAQRQARRNRVTVFTLTIVIALVGVAAGLMWMKQGGLTPEGRYPDEGLVFAGPAETNPVQPEENPQEPEPVLTPDAAAEVVGRQEALPALRQAVGSTTSAARIQTVLAARDPSPTPTPLPLLDRLDAVVGVGGADLWDEESGLLLARLPQGVRFMASERSVDGRWLFGTSGAGESGWVAAEQLIALDPRRLPGREVNILPITPTVDVALALSPTPTPGSTTTSPAASAAPSTRAAVPNLGPPDVADGPVARISLTRSRLNVRAGPGSQYPIVTKAHPGELFPVLGRSAQGDWVQLAVPDVAEGFGWVVAEYVDITGALDEIPLSDVVSNAPAYVEGAERERVRQQRQAAAGTHSDPPRLPDAEVASMEPAPVSAPQPAAQADPAGLQGKLAIQTTWSGDIYLYDFATGDLRFLTHGFDPALSPDGTQVAFTRDGGEHGLYLINSDGTNERRIFGGRELLRSPKWSPDGQWIVFSRFDGTYKCFDLGRSNLCVAESELVPPPPEGLTDEQLEQYHAMRRRILNRFERQERPNWTLARVNAEGGEYRDIAALNSALTPDWNEAGIVYQSNTSLEITADEPDATTRSVLAGHNLYDPDWQPNGGRIVYQQRRSSHWQIFVVNPDGSGNVALTRPATTLVDQLPSSVTPAWSPDGRHIVFLSNRQPDHEAGDWAIWVMDADGSNQRKLPIDLPITYTYVGEQMLSWSR